MLSNEFSSVLKKETPYDHKMVFFIYFGQLKLLGKICIWKGYKKWLQ